MKRLLNILRLLAASAVFSACIGALSAFPRISKLSSRKPHRSPTIPGHWRTNFLACQNIAGMEIYVESL